MIALSPILQKVESNQRKGCWKHILFRRKKKLSCFDQQKEGYKLKRGGQQRWFCHNNVQESL